MRRSKFLPPRHTLMALRVHRFVNPWARPCAFLIGTQVANRKKDFPSSKPCMITQSALLRSRHQWTGRLSHFPWELTQPFLSDLQQDLLSDEAR